MLTTSPAIIRGLQQTSSDTWSLALEAGNNTVMVLSVSTESLLQFYGQNGIRWHAMQRGLWLEHHSEGEWAALVAQFIKSIPQQQSSPQQLQTVQPALVRPFKE